MNCNEINQLISLYLDDFLETETQIEFLEHIKNCPSCAKELEETKTLLSQVQSLPPVPFPSGLHEEIMKSVTAVKDQGVIPFPETTVPPKRKAFRFQNYGTLVAGLLLVLAVGGKSFLPQSTSLTQPNLKSSTEKQRTLTRDTSEDSLLTTAEVTSENSVAPKAVETPNTAGTPDTAKASVTTETPKATKPETPLPTQKQAPSALAEQPQKASVFQGTPTPTEESSPTVTQSVQERSVLSDSPTLFAQSEPEPPAVASRCITLTATGDLTNTTATIYNAIEKENGTVLEAYTPQTAWIRCLVPTAKADTWETTLSSLGSLQETALTKNVATQYQDDTEVMPTLQKQQQLLLLQKQNDAAFSKTALDSVEEELQTIENKRKAWESETPMTLFNLYLQEG